MKQTHLLILSIAAALGAAGIYAQSPAPAPLEAALSASVDVLVPVAPTVQSVSTIHIDWILIESDKEKITVKVQPFNKEFVIANGDYVTVRDALRPGLANNLLPLLMPKVNEYAAALKQAQ